MCLCWTACCSVGSSPGHTQVPGSYQVSDLADTWYHARKLIQSFRSVLPLFYLVAKSAHFTRKSHVHIFATQIVLPRAWTDCSLPYAHHPSLPFQLISLQRRQLRGAHLSRRLGADVHERSIHAEYPLSAPLAGVHPWPEAFNASDAY